MATELIDQTAAARLLGLSNPKTLSAWRLKRRGPPYVKIEGCVRYSVDHLREWISQHTVKNGGAV